MPLVGSYNIQNPIKENKGKGKCKLHPVTGHEGPEWEKRYSSTLSLTSALDWGAWSTPCPSHYTSRKAVQVKHFIAATLL
jgi:hypothetical protein